MSRKPGILDANVLIYATASESPQHAASKALRYVADSLRVLLDWHESAPDDHGAFEREAFAAVDSFLGFLEVLPVPASAVDGWMGLLRRRTVIGADIFDLQLVAVMLANRVTTIYTWNDQTSGRFRNSRSRNRNPVAALC